VLLIRSGVCDPCARDHGHCVRRGLRCLGFHAGYHCLFLIIVLEGKDNGQEPFGGMEYRCGKVAAVLLECQASDWQELPHLVYDHLMEIDNHTARLGGGRGVKPCVEPEMN